MEAILLHAHLLGSYATEAMRRLPCRHSLFTEHELDCLAWLGEGLPWKLSGGWH